MTRRQRELEALLLVSRMFASGSIYDRPRLRRALTVLRDIPEIVETHSDIPQQLIDALYRKNRDPKLVSRLLPSLAYRAKLVYLSRQQRGKPKHWSGRPGLKRRNFRGLREKVVEFLPGSQVRDPAKARVRREVREEFGPDGKGKA